MATDTNLSAEQPSERASTGPRLEVKGEFRLSAPGGHSVEAKGSINAPSGSGIEHAVTIFVMLAAAVLLPAAEAAILTTTGMAGWLVGTFAGAALAMCLATVATVVIRKGWLKA